jgi:hypothetical protein
VGNPAATLDCSKECSLVAEIPPGAAGNQIQSFQRHEISGPAGGAPKSTLLSRKALGRDVLQRLGSELRDARLDSRQTVVDDTDADLLVGLVSGKQRQVPAVIAGTFEADDVGIEPQGGTARRARSSALPNRPAAGWDAPAGVHPNLGINPGKLTVERLGLEFEIRIGAVRPGVRPCCRRRSRCRARPPPAR